MRRVLGKCGKLMRDMNNNEGAEQASKALSALDWPRRQMDPSLRKEEEVALKQMISGIIPEWCDTNNNRKKGVIALFTSWTGEMMNYARIQMKTWIATKNEHKAYVQRRWDNRDKMNKAFQTWRKGLRQEYDEQGAGKEEGKERIEREKTHGIKYWGRVRTIPKIHKQVRKFLQTGIG
eukprot:6189738-Pleurochrysis_carterae.AAC.2